METAPLPQDKPVNRRRRFWFRFILIALIPLWFVLAGELAFRFAGVDRPAYIELTEPECVEVLENQPAGWRWKANACGVNRRGLFDVDIPVENEPPEDRFRILWSGDSVAAGAGVRRTETYENLVEDRLRRDGLAVESINLGQPGSNPQQWLAAWRSSGLKGHAAVFSLCPNDADPALMLVAGENAVWRPVDSPDGPLYRPMPLTGLWWRSRFLQTLISRAVMPGDVDEWDVSARSVDAAIHAPAAMRAAGMRVLVILLPFFGRPHPEQIRDLDRCRRFQQRVSEGLLREGVPLVVLGRDCLAENPDFQLHPDDHYHPNPAGHVWIADHLTAPVSRLAQNPAEKP